MDGPRAPTENEWPLVIDFLDQNLRAGQGWSIQKEYPLALGPGNIENVRVIVEDKKVLSHAVIKYLLIKTPIGFFKVAAIGSVITSESHRGQGLSKAVLDSCIQRATESGCDFAILWTNLFDFYRKLGFELAGLELSAIIEHPLSVPVMNLKILETTHISPEAIYRLYAHHSVGTIRTVEDIRKNITIPGSRIYTAWDERNQLQAYAVEGKGVDLKGYVHEWGGGVSRLLPLFNHIREKQKDKLTVLIPAHSQNLISNLEQQGVFIHRGYLGMVKILHLGNLIAKIQRSARAKGIEDLLLEETAQGLKIGTRNNSVLLQGERDLPRLFFGPFQSQDIPGLEPRSIEVMDQLFPIPMWVWGWDSV
jgi:GNAT superfamily N-acetyltransferase